VLQRARDARNEHRLIAAREAAPRGEGVRVIDTETPQEFPHTTALTREP
jgi:hypothetical protein